MRGVTLPIHAETCHRDVVDKLVAAGEVKPCPFCGSPDLVVGQFPGPCYAVSCGRCGGVGPRFAEPVDPKSYPATQRRLITRAVRAWGTRNGEV
jgi:hypothetical protein